MAHKLVSGIDRMASTRLDTVWHRDETLQDGRLRQIVYAEDAEATLLEMAGYVWPVDADNDIARTDRLVTVHGEPVETHVATISPSGRILGVVGSTYSPVAFKIILRDWVLELARAGGIPETLGTYDAGRNMFACVQVAPAWHVPGDHSETRPFCNVLGNHTGEGGIRGSFATFRPVCANTAGMLATEHDAVTDAQERAKRAWVTVRHYGDTAQRIQDAVAWIIDGRARAEREQALLARLASKLVSKDDVVRFVDQYINIPDDATARVRTGRENERATFGQVLRDQNNLGEHAWTGHGMTAYGLLQSVTNFEDWQSRTRGADDVPVATRRAFRAFLGEREPEKITARERILELVR